MTTTATLTTEISARVTGTDDWSEASPNYCAADYTVRLTIGDRHLDLTGWVIGGWIKPGASQDIDGSALDNWGNSQPGGWSVSDGNGCAGGRVVCEEAGPSDDYDSPVTIYSHSTDSVDPQDVPEWHAACQRADDLIGADQEAEYDQAVEQAQAIRCAVIDAVTTALSAIRSPAPEEPSAEDLYDDLGEIDGAEVLPVRLGNWRGAGVAMAWMADGEYRSTYWPDESDILRTVSEVQSDAIDAILAAVASLASDD